MIAAEASVCYRFGRFELQPGERRLLASGEPLHLGPHAFDLLVVLAERSGRLVSKDELLQRVWGKVIVEDNTLQAHVSALRKALGAQAIATVSGMGYRFTLEVAKHSPRAASAGRRDNLPHALTSFVGRETQLEQLRNLMATTRLLTLTGSGGCGKTRLALKASAEMLASYPDGVWLVELAPLADAGLIPQAIAKALAIREQAGGDLLEAIADWLASRQVLLLLDNAEHLLDPCARIAESLLQRCAGLSILVTSRERLGIAGELTYRVPSLSVPDAERDVPPEVTFATEAARLFIDRARLQRFDLQVTDRDAAALGSICRRLDGIALAIELAAPCVRLMSVEELSRRLEDRFGVLTEGSRTALPRHRTLRSLIDWSYDMLGEAEKRVLNRASVFAAGCTLEAAERVCSGGIVEARDLADLLASLADKNLMTVERRSGEPRFGMLETVRHYARDRLGESGEESPVRERHLAHFLEAAERLDVAPDDAERAAMLDHLDAEHDNLRTALAWCEADAGRSLAGLRLAGQLYWLWATRSHLAEGRGWIERLLAASPGHAREEDHARALHAAGTLAVSQADYAAAESLHGEALALWQRLGERRQTARSLGSLGNIARFRDDLPTARTLYEQALTLMREVGDARGMAVALHCLGMVALRAGDLVAAQSWLEESVLVGRTLGGWSGADSLAQLGKMRHVNGDYAAARALLAEAQEGHRAFGNKAGVALTQVALAVVSHREGDVAAAKALFAEALAALRVLGYRIDMSSALEAFASLLLDLARPADAARLWGCTQRSREDNGQPMELADRAQYERDVAAARQASNDDAAFDAAWGEGRSWALDDAVRYATGLAAD